MIAALQPFKRTIVPRWRNSTVAATTGELAPLQVRPASTLPADEELLRLIEEWQAHRSVAFASDLLAAGLVLDSVDREEVVDAGNYVISLGTQVPSAVTRLAKSVRGSLDDYYELSDTTGQYEIVEHSRQAIRDQKHSLRVQPRNSMAWVDIARHYATLGENRKALSSMERASILDPDNRFVLRSAARLYIHLEDFERGYDVLRRSPAVRVDPWLRAAEIAIAGLMDKMPSRLGHTRRVLRASKLAPLHVSELATAVATFELNAGSTRSARYLFNLGLEDPTENAVAQANWASGHVSGISLLPNHFRLPRTYEARAIHHFEKLELAECLSECLNWLMDEPFSLRPVEIGTFAAIVGFEDYQNAIRLAKWGLQSHSDSFTLRNNLTIALAELGSLDEAKAEFGRINSESLGRNAEMYWLATRGLLAFRELAYEEGRRLYQQAVDSAAHESDKLTKVMALLHWALEEIRASEYERADDIHRELSELATGIDDPSLKLALTRYDRLRNEILADVALHKGSSLV